MWPPCRIVMGGSTRDRDVVNLDQLQTFLVLVRCGSFTGAAAELHLSQPAVSRHIQRLEGELGATLLTRRRGWIELSEAGGRGGPHSETGGGGRGRPVAAPSGDPGRRSAEAPITPPPS